MTTEEPEILDMSGAGFILFNKSSMSSKSPLMLALVCSNGLYDIPKGDTEEGESPIDTAVRECFEECSILLDDVEVIDGLTYVSGPLTVFGACTDKVPAVTKNPTTGILEHEQFKWVTKQQFLSNCIFYLKPFAEHFYSAYNTYYNP